MPEEKHVVYVGGYRIVLTVRFDPDQQREYLDIEARNSALGILPRSSNHIEIWPAG